MNVPLPMQRIRYALAHPKYAVGALFRRLFLVDEALLARVAGRPALEMRALMREPLADPQMREVVSQALRASGTERLGAVAAGRKARIQYALVRATRPKVVVETGVANGVSSSYLLRAMERNGVGQLHSVDIGTGEHLPPGKQVGWLVPERLRDRWRLHIADSRAVLPTLLRELGAVDLFIHDSLHTREHMLFEYRTAYPFVRSGGILVSDDVLWNTAWQEFTRELPASRHCIVSGVGVLFKA